MLLKTVLLVMGGLAVLVGVVLAVGAMLPREHRTSGVATLTAPPERVAALVGDPASYGRWRKGVTVSDVRTQGDVVLWRETSGGDIVDYALSEEVAGRRWRSTILTQGMAYGGYWLIEVEPEAAGSRVTVTEHGFVDNLAFRALGRFVFGFDSTLKAWLRELAAA